MSNKSCCCMTLVSSCGEWIGEEEAGGENNYYLLRKGVRIIVTAVAQGGEGEVYGGGRCGV